MHNSTINNNNNRLSIATIEGSEMNFSPQPIFKNNSHISSPNSQTSALRLSNSNQEDISKGIMLIGNGNNRRLTNTSLNSPTFFTKSSSTTSSSISSSLKSETNNNKKRFSKNR